MFCGERGIRTPGGFHLNGFQDRRIRPLCHLSGANVSVQVKTTKLNLQPVSKTILFVKSLIGSLRGGDPYLQNINC